MTLDEARKFVEKKFERVQVTDKEDPKLDWVCSGGQAPYKEVMPALYSTEERAIDAWVQELHRMVGPTWAGWSFMTLEWVYVPEICQFQMTMADRIGRHRVVTPRFAVRCQMRVK